MPQRIPNPRDDQASGAYAYPTLRSDRALASPLDPTIPPYVPGEVVAGKYRVEEVLGCGGMAWVLRATHVQLNLTVALKFLRFEATREAVARFFQEGRAAARMSSEAVTRVLDVDRLADGSPFLVMEFLDGFDLQKLVDEPGWLPVPTAVDFAIQACEGLTAVHGAGIVHRDLKPANLFLTRKRNGSLRMKLIDFGISKLPAAAPLLLGHERPDTSPHALMGSPVYMAPEQMRSTKNVDARADIWSLGVILYELLGAGRSPFEAATLPEVCMRVMRETPERLSAIRHDLPLGLETVVARCLEKEPSRRFPDASSLAIALAPYASQRGQLRARRLQHRPRSAERANTPVPAVNVALTARPSLPGINPPPRRSSAAPPPAPITSVQEACGSLPPAQWRPEMRPLDRRVACVAVGFWTLAALLGIAVLAGRIKTAPVSPAPDTAAVGVANHMPEATPATLPAPVSLAPLEAPVLAEHVYSPEELPRVTPTVVTPAAPTAPRAAQAIAQETPAPAARAAQAMAAETPAPTTPAQALPVTPVTTAPPRAAHPVPASAQGRVGPDGF